MSTWYQNPVPSYENLSKAVACLPHYICTQFFRATHDCNLKDDTINLLLFEDWLKKQIKDQFNPLAEIIALQEAKLKQNQNSKDHRYQNRVHSTLISKYTQQNNKNEKEDPSKPENNDEKLACWLCKVKYHFMTGVEIREKFLTRHKFTNWLKSVLWPWFTARGKFWLFNILDCWKMAFPHLKGKLTLLAKTSKWN